MGDDGIYSKAVIGGLCLTVLSGCAVSYETSDGPGGQAYRHVIGLAQVEISRAGPGQPSLDGHVLTIRSLGLGLNQSAQGANVNLGYAEEISAILRTCDTDRFDDAQDPCGVAQTPWFTDGRRVSGAAYAHKEETGDGSRIQWTGFVNLKIPVPRKPPAGTAVHVNATGLSFVSNAMERSAALGYAASTLVRPGPDVYVRGNPLTDIVSPADPAPATETAARLEPPQ